MSLRVCRRLARAQLETSADNQEMTRRSTPSGRVTMAELLLTLLAMRRLLIAHGDAALPWDRPQGSLSTARRVAQANLCAAWVFPSLLPPVLAFLQTRGKDRRRRR